MDLKIKKHLLALALLGGSTLAVADNVAVQVLSAVVKDQRIDGATVILQKNGAQSVSATTNAQGMVTLNSNFVDSADTLLIIKKNGYSNLVAKCPCKDMTYAISPVMKNLDGLRIVLNWGRSPEDLDSHLAFPDNHIYFEHKTGNRQTQANLDVDDTNSYGPETITIEKKHQGESYVYAVHDYTNSSNPNANALTNSNAKIFVYVGQSLVRSYYVPKNKSGNLWTVFRITSDGDFQDINTLTGTHLEAADVLNSVNTYLNRNTQVVAQEVSVDNQNSAKSLNQQGEQAYHAGNFDEAISFYQQAIDSNPNYGQAYSNLGLVFQKAGRTSEAIWANRKAIALATGSSANTVRASSYYNIARIYESAAQYDDALEYYQKASQQKSNAIYDKAIDRVKKLK